MHGGAAALLPPGDLRVVEGGHLPLLTSTPAVAALAHEFLTERAVVMT